MTIQRTVSIRIRLERIGVMGKDLGIIIQAVAVGVCFSRAGPMGCFISIGNAVAIDVIVVKDPQR